MPIDVHAHYVPPGVLEALRARGAEYGIAVAPGGAPSCPSLSFGNGLRLRPFVPRLMEEEAARIESFLTAGVDRQVLSVWSDLMGYGLAPAKGQAWHRLMNDCLAQVCARHPTRFSFLASAPLQDPAIAAREATRAVRELGAVGLLVAANVLGTNLGEVPLDEFWSTVSQLGVPVFIHPTEPVPPPRTRRWTLTQVVQFTYDTTLALSSLIFSGTLDRFPALQFILPHGGGLLPYLSGRLDHMHGRMDRAAEGDLALQAPSAYFPRCYFDTLLHQPHVLRFLIDSVGLERVVLGSDWPFPPGTDTPLAVLQAAGLASSQIAAIVDHNPRRLFKLG